METPRDVGLCGLNDYKHDDDDDNDGVCLKTKCECYLPDRCGVYGDIEVTVTDCQTDVAFCCTKRSLQLRVNVNVINATIVARASVVRRLCHWRRIALRAFSTRSAAFQRPDCEVFFRIVFALRLRLNDTSYSKSDRRSK